MNLLTLLTNICACLLLVLVTLPTSAATNSKVSATVRAKILAQGVPAASLDRLLEFMDRYVGDEILTDTYTCHDPKETDKNPVKPCAEGHRQRASRKIEIVNPKYLVVVDFSRPSTEKRLHLIELASGEVQKFLTTHGKGSGEGLYPERFGNKKDSRMSSLGIYRVGEIYDGKYGATMRLYGLEKTNDQAYNRDIVMHGAWYAREAFAKKINPRTKAPFGRIGVSWGCPAVAPDVQKKLIPLLKENALIDIYHPQLTGGAPAKPTNDVQPAIPNNDASEEVVGPEVEAPPAGDQASVESNF